MSCERRNPTLFGRRWSRYVKHPDVRVRQTRALTVGQTVKVVVTDSHPPPLHGQLPAVSRERDLTVSRRRGWRPCDSWGPRDAAHHYLTQSVCEPQVGDGAVLMHGLSPVAQLNRVSASGTEGYGHDHIAVWRWWASA